MSTRSGGRRFAIYAACVLLLIGGVWVVTRLLPPTGPQDQREALVEIQDVFGRIDSTLPSGTIEQSDEETTAQQCPGDQPGTQSTMTRRYSLADFAWSEWREALEAEFPSEDGWVMHVRGVGSSGGVNVRLTNLDLLATQLYLVPVDAGQMLQLQADSRCYPTPSG